MTYLPTDHVGFVVRDLTAAVATFRNLGFHVSQPQPLMGDNGPLGQASAHMVFENGYVEFSSPDPGSENHLLPYLEEGEGVRIYVLRSDDIEADHAAAQAANIAAATVAGSSRTVCIGGREQIARFKWFPLKAEVWPGVLLAVMQHQSIDLVFHDSFIIHPNGCRHFDSIAVSSGPQSVPMKHRTWIPSLARIDTVPTHRAPVAALRFRGADKARELTWKQTDVTLLP